MYFFHLHIFCIVNYNIRQGAGVRFPLPSSSLPPTKNQNGSPKKQTIDIYACMQSVKLV